jgi:hypothetical protein
MRSSPTTRRPDANQHWKAKVRQQVQTDDFERVGRWGISTESRLTRPVRTGRNHIADAGNMVAE